MRLALSLSEGLILLKTFLMSTFLASTVRRCGLCCVMETY